MFQDMAIVRHFFCVINADQLPAIMELPNSINFFNAFFGYTENWKLCFRNHNTISVYHITLLKNKYNI